MILHAIVRIVRIPICFPNGNILQSSSIVLNHNQGVNIDTAETETIFIACLWSHPLFFYSQAHLNLWQPVP